MADGTAAGRTRNPIGQTEQYTRAAQRPAGDHGQASAEGTDG